MLDNPRREEASSRTKWIDRRPQDRIQPIFLGKVSVMRLTPSRSGNSRARSGQCAVRFVATEFVSCPEASMVQYVRPRTTVSCSCGQVRETPRPPDSCHGQTLLKQHIVNIENVNSVKV